MFCHGQVDPFEPEIDWFTRDKEIHPLSAAPEPKRRFMPSKWEEKKCALTCIIHISELASSESTLLAFAVPSFAADFECSYRLVV